MNLNPSPAQKIQALALQYGSYLTLTFIIAIYLSTGAATVISILLGLLWLVSGQLLALPKLIKAQPVALWALLLFALLIIGAAYSSASWPTAYGIINKYRELFYIPVLMAFFGTGRNRHQAWLAFVFASVLTLVISYLKFFGVLELNRFGDPAIKSHITHSLFIALFGFYCLQRIYVDKQYRYLYLGLFIVCLHNQFLAVEGRTGQAAFIGLVLLFVLQRFQRKQLLLSLVAISLAMLLYINFSEKAQRINEGISETQGYLQENQKKDMKSPMAQRYMFWQYSLKLIAEKPLIGHGTGSFAQEYKRIAQGERLLTNNPHNEFLMFTVQLGLLGLVVYLGFMGSQLYAAQRLAVDDKFMAQGLLLTLVVTSLFNSPIMDNTEGHWFATLIALCFSPLYNTNTTNDA